MYSQLAAQQRYSDFQRVVWDEMRHIDKNHIVDPTLFRQVTLMSNIGASALVPDQLDRYNRIVNDMLAIYNKASICRFEQPFNCGLRLQPHLKEVEFSRIVDEITKVEMFDLCLAYGNESRLGRTSVHLD